MSATAYVGYDEVAYAKQLESLGDRAFMDQVFAQLDRANQFAVFSTADAKARQCFAEAERRGRGDLYDRAFEAALAVAKGDAAYRRAFEQFEAVR